MARYSYRKYGSRIDEGPPKMMPDYAEPRSWHRRVDFTIPEYTAFQEKKLDKLWEEPLADDKEPRGNHYCNEFGPNAKTRYPKCLTKGQVLGRLKYWPHIPNAITSAPFLLNPQEWKLSRPVMQSDNALIKFMSIPEMGAQVLEYFTHEDLKNLALASSSTHQIVSQQLDRWDFTAEDFNCCKQIIIELQEKMLTDQGSPPDSQTPRRVGRLVIASPVRLGLEDTFPYERKQLPCAKQLFSTYRLCQSIYYCGWNIRTLFLHRIPFLDVRLVRLLLAPSQLPNLQRLGLYRCELLHFGNTMGLLDAVEDRRYEGGRPVDHFDFYPRFHEGPNDVRREGSFGISWQDSSIHSAMAIFSCLLYRILPKAEELGFDLVSRSSSFRLWLEKIPLPEFSVPRALDLYYKNPSVFKQTKYDVPHLWIRGGAEQTLLRKLFQAITVPGSHHDPPSEEYLHPTHCDTCSLRYPIFLMRSEYYSTCAGCFLGSILNEERDHYKVNKKYIVTKLLQRDFDTLPDPNMDDLVTSIDEVVNTDQMGLAGVNTRPDRVMVATNYANNLQDMRWFNKGRTCYIPDDPRSQMRYHPRAAGLFCTSDNPFMLPGDWDGPGAVQQIHPHDKDNTSRDYWKLSVNERLDGMHYFRAFDWDLILGREKPKLPFRFCDLSTSEQAYRDLLVQAPPPQWYSQKNRSAAVSAMRTQWPTMTRAAAKARQKVVEKQKAENIW